MPTIRRCTALVGLLVAVLGLVACTPEQQAIYDEVNAERMALGLPGLLPHASAMNEAQRRAEVLAAENDLYHFSEPSLAQGLSGDWRFVGENVGRGPDMESIQAAFMASPDHRANVLNPRFNFVGVGHTVAADGTVYVVHLFVEY